MKTLPTFILATLLLVLLIAVQTQAVDMPTPAAPVSSTPEKTNQWSPEKAREWYHQQPWMVGCNFLPSTAINQVEMFQPGTYDPVTIRRELAMAKGLGFNTLRVFLHDILWKEEVREGFLKNFDDFLGICESNGMRCIIVFFDDCHWDHDIKLGAQQPRVTGVHNSGWFKCPGSKLVTAYANQTISDNDKARLKGYVQGILQRYAHDSRIVMWDIYNEPSLPKTKVLLTDAWTWAREINPSQPLSGCAFGGARQYQDIQCPNSDILTYHCYATGGQLKSITELKNQYSQRPVICTEYMARDGSTFQHDLPILKENKVGAINWGFVNGKSGTVWRWPSQKPLHDIVDHPDWSLAKIEKEIGFDRPAPGKNYPEPTLWFHDIFRMDGTPFDQKEVDFIKEITGAKNDRP
jgi:hypothetical protein